jgi:hypothetical protein
MTDFPFYEFDDESKTTGTPTRQLNAFIDNAPYHHGGAANVQSWSKKFILEVLQDHGVQSIPTTLPDGLPLRVEVPAKGSAWPAGHPNAEQVRKGATIALTEIKPLMFEVPWQYILDQADIDWGGSTGKRPRNLPTDGTTKWWKNTFTAPYTPTFWAIELMWAFGKNFVALAENQKTGRSPAEVIILLRNRFCNPGEENAMIWERNFRHCEALMNQWIMLHHEHNMGPLSGTIDDPIGMPDEAQYNQWRKNAGMDSDADEIDHGLFVGDIGGDN